MHGGCSCRRARLALNLLVGALLWSAGGAGFGIRIGRRARDRRFTRRRGLARTLLGGERRAAMGTAGAIDRVAAVVAGRALPP